MPLYSLPLFLGKKDFSDYLQIADLDAMMQKKREVFQSLTFICRVWDRPATRFIPIFCLFPGV